MFCSIFRQIAYTFDYIFSMILRALESTININKIIIQVELVFFMFECFEVKKTA